MTRLLVVPVFLGPSFNRKQIIQKLKILDDLFNDLNGKALRHRALDELREVALHGFERGHVDVHHVSRIVVGHAEIAAQ